MTVGLAMLVVFYVAGLLFASLMMAIKVTAEKKFRIWNKPRFCMLWCALWPIFVLIEIVTWIVTDDWGF